jgi:PAS domain S-box-containing protein
MKYFHKKVWLGFLTAIAIIAWLAITSYSNNKKSESSAQWVAHTNRVLYHSEQVLALTVDLESGQRGYALTGDPEFLKPSAFSSNRLTEHIKSLQSLTSDNESQLERIDELEELVNKKVEFTRKAIDVRNNSGLDSVIALNATLEGKSLMDKIRQTIKEIQGEEQRLLEERTRQISKRISNFNAAFASMLFATGLILLAVFYTIYVSLKRRSEAEQSLRQASETIKDIYENAPCGYHSLNSEGVFVEMNNTWLQWLRYTREEVVNKMKFRDILTDTSAAIFDVTFPKFKVEKKFSDQLFDVVRKDGTTFSILLNSVAIYDDAGNFLKSRSTVIDYTEQKKSLEKIEQLNQELESFSYSVSHDLRAPLRSIDGYTQILLEDYAHSLDSEGKRVLTVVVNNARKMAKLIDDLLDFSRVGRKDVTRTVVNSESLVRSVVSELRSVEDGRNVDIRIAPLDPCEADPNLLRQVWINLISNAIKYTRKKEIAVIDISSHKTSSEIVFKITDNGTGFDMQYAHKLFGVFQRLHRQQEFEGTGVGLAIVHRIVSRHGGRVWAEGDVNKGASFYFSLPNSIA